MNGAQTSKNAIICGAGIGGLAAGLALSRKGVEATVIERAETLNEVGAGIQLSPNATHVLKALGLEEEIQEAAFEPISSTIRDYKTGSAYVEIPLKELCQTRYGARYYHIHRADLHRILREAAREAGVEIELGETAIGYTETVEKTHLQTDKGVHTADVLIGADRLRSTIRDAMLGPEAPAYRGQVAWRGTVRATDLPKDLIAPKATVWVGPHHHFVTYYINSGTLVNFVAVQERSNWTNTSWTEPGDISELRAAFREWHPEIRALLEATTECYLWALFARDPLPTWVDRRVALLGDAAHPMLPFMAQGAAMALEDAWVLADQLGRDPGTDALGQYEQVRAPRAAMVQRASEANAKLFHRRSTPLDLWPRAKLQMARAIPALAINQLEKIYGVNVTRS